MLAMTKTPITPVRLPEPIKEAAQAWCAEHGGAPLSETMVVALCHHIGRPDLVDVIRQRGRPKAAPEPAPVKPIRKAARKRK